MTKFLHRPMFRTGGSAGQGITSGLTRPGYHRGRVVNPGGYKGSPTDLIWTDEEREQMMKALPARGKSSAGADFWLNFGTNILAQPGGRPILQTLGTAAKEPLAQLQKTKAYERMAPREEEVDLLKTFMTSKGDMMSDSGSSDLAWREKNALRLREAKAQMFSHNKAWKPEWNNIENLEGEAKDIAQQELQQWKNEKYLIDGDIDQFEKDAALDLEMIIGGKVGVEELHRMFKKKLQADESPMIGPDGKPMLEDPNDPTSIITISDYYLDPDNFGELRIKMIEMTYEEIDKIKSKRRGWTAEKGGRAGYQGGELVEQEDVNIQTPRGDISMQETVEEGAEPDQLSYEELRSRLPVEITDDIVRLLVSSASALGDFAQIQTQVDVDNFNAKYGVNLVLPSEA